jgi:hypothetical protein
MLTMTEAWLDLADRARVGSQHVGKSATIIPLLRTKMTGDDDK